LSTTTAGSTCSVPISGPLDLKATLKPLHGWFGPDGWWLTARSPEGPVSLRVSRTRYELNGTAWGEGAAWALDRLPAICGLEDDPSSFRTDHPMVGELHRRNPGWRFGKTGLVFDAVVHAINGQKVTGAEAAAATRGLRERFGQPAPGQSGLRLPPDPERMAGSPYWMFHELHLEKKRADILRRVAARADAIDRLATRPTEEADRVLSAIPGIGPWTVSKTLSVSHGDPDQVDVGDFHLKHMVVHHLTGRPRGSDEEMLGLLEQFRPHRGRVARLLHTLGHGPSYGPRLAPKDITQM
jgi:3-methyladenine DNA glycosylase/8-oxoguanine DNA glycosylase